MLTIRPDQVDMFRREAQARQELKLARHFMQYYPRECREAGGEPAVLKVVRLGMEKASDHGYATLKQAGFTVGLMFMLGADFDLDSQIPWAARKLEDVAVADRDRRILNVHEEAVAFLARTAGEKNEHIVKAMIRLKAVDLKEYPAPGSPGWESGVFALLARWYPQKVEVQGEEATKALIRTTSAAAAKYRISSAPGLGLYATLMFMLGSGFDRDPLYPWAARALTNPGIPNEAARVTTLHRDALGYVQAALTSK
jgi:hypothetical protein